MLPAVLVFLAAGCATSGPPLVPVSGQVWLDKKPLALKTIRFVPEPGTPGLGAGATTDADGKYTLIAVRPGATKDVLGVAPGAYRVVVTEPIFPIETATVQGGDGPAPAIGLPDPRKRRVVPHTPKRTRHHFVCACPNRAVSWI